MSYYELFKYYSDIGIEPSELLFLLYVFKNKETLVVKNNYYPKLSKLGLIARSKTKQKHLITLKGKRLLNKFLKDIDPFEYDYLDSALKQPLLGQNKLIAELCVNYRGLFPQGVKSGGRPVRGDKASIESKLLKFIKKYPEFTPEIILTATKGYINEMKANNYMYMTCADYLIEKNQNSQLAALCESYIESPEISIDNQTKLLE